MRSDAFDQQRELRIKEGWRGRWRWWEERIFGDGSCAEDVHNNNDEFLWWDQM